MTAFGGDTCEVVDVEDCRSDTSVVMNWLELARVS